MGRAAHSPTPASRKMVIDLALAGIPQLVICKVIGIASDKTLSKHYRAELDAAEPQMLALVAGALFQNALGGNVTAQIFIMKTRGGWKETTKQEITGPDGLPLSMAAPNVYLSINGDGEEAREDGF